MSEGSENMMQSKPVLTDTGLPETPEMGARDFSLLSSSHMCSSEEEHVCSDLARG